MKKNFYKVLGVNQKAGPDKIKRAYRKAAKRFHPDVSRRNGEKFREIQEAYETLSDPERKALYDREGLKNRSPAARPQPDYSYPSESVPSSLFNEIETFFRRFEDFWENPWADFFSEIEQSRQALSVEIILTPSEARKGCEVLLEIPVWNRCRRCRGTGTVREWICGLCRGRGEERLEKKIRVTFPAGVKSGTEIRIPLGRLGLRGGDLTATVKVARR